MSANLASYTEVLNSTKKLFKDHGGHLIFSGCDVCKPCLQSPALLGVNTVYIVAAVVINETNKVLLIQESKQSCQGKWYLPAGRVEKQESLVDAVKRECLEETGLHIKPTGLVSIEFDGPSWMRFTFTGRVEAGTLKTKADSESIQAQWFSQDNINVKTLRSRDALGLIDETTKYLEKFKKGTNSFKVLPLGIKQTLQVWRMAIVFSHQDSLYILNAVNKPKGHLPIGCFSGEVSNPKEVARRFLNKACAETSTSNRIKLEKPLAFGVEHLPQETKNCDGMAISILIKAAHASSKFSHELPRLKIGGPARWVQIPNLSDLYGIINNFSTYGVAITDLGYTEWGETSADI